MNTKLLKSGQGQASNGSSSPSLTGSGQALATEFAETDICGLVYFLTDWNFSLDQLKTLTAAVQTKVPKLKGP